MLINQTVEMAWNPRNKKRYMDLGYTYTKMGDTFHVDVNDLPEYSQVEMTVVCDYCGKQFNRRWFLIARGRRSGLLIDCCSDPHCTSLKAADAMEHLHGVRYSAYIPETIQKRKKTCLDRYGAENPFSSEAIKEKIVESNLKKYGVKHSQQAPEVRAKTESTCMQKYGVANYVELFAGKFIGENSPVWKGGADVSGRPRATYGYVDWRKTVFGRDSHTCQCCGVKNGNGKSVVLNAHHIKNWADNPDDRFDLNNGITLCEKCHSEFHRKYGKKNNTDAQLFEFLSDKKVC